MLGTKSKETLLKNKREGRKDSEIPKIKSYTIIKTQKDGKDLYQAVEIVTYEDFVLEVNPKSEKLRSRPDAVNSFRLAILENVIKPFTT